MTLMALLWIISVIIKNVSIVDFSGDLDFSVLPQEAGYLYLDLSL